MPGNIPLDSKKLVYTTEIKCTKKAFLASIGRIKAYKNKYNSNEAKHSPTHASA
jgi:hypothetical protein